MNENICIACKKQMIDFVLNKNYTILKCSACRLGKTLNLIPQKEEYHRDDTYIKEQELFKNIFQRRVNIVQKLHPTLGKILEIGSSTGLMLSLFASNGWDVTGVEISPESANFAIKKGIKTIKQPFEKIDFKNEKFDVVIINHTLEHLENPIDVIARIHKILNVGGLVLIDVPNFDSFWARVLKMSWPMLLPKEHLWHFTKQSLSLILQGQGFKVELTTMPSGLFDLASPASELFLALTKFKKRFFTEMINAPIDAILTATNQGNDLTIVAKKI